MDLLVFVSTDALACTGLLISRVVPAITCEVSPCRLAGASNSRVFDPCTGETRKHSLRMSVLRRGWMVAQRPFAASAGRSYD
eukprot:4092989-Pleurochrysis_carterae.AAC.2